MQNDYLKCISYYKLTCMYKLFIQSKEINSAVSGFESSFTWEDSFDVAREDVGREVGGWYCNCCPWDTGTWAIPCIDGTPGAWEACIAGFDVKIDPVVVPGGIWIVADPWDEIGVFETWGCIEDPWGPGIEDDCWGPICRPTTCPGGPCAPGPICAGDGPIWLCGTWGIVWGIWFGGPGCVICGPWCGGICTVVGCVCVIWLGGGPCCDGGGPIWCPPVCWSCGMGFVIWDIFKRNIEN